MSLNELLYDYVQLILIRLVIIGLFQAKGTKNCMSTNVNGGSHTSSKICRTLCGVDWSCHQWGHTMFVTLVYPQKSWYYL